MYFGVWMLKGLKGGPAALIETFARFQAGFLSSEDFHRFLLIIMDFHDFDGLLGLLGLLEGVLCFLTLLEGGLKHVVSHARRSGEVGGLSQIFMDFHRFS